MEPRLLHLDLQADQFARQSADVGLSFPGHHLPDLIHPNGVAILRRELRDLAARTHPLLYRSPAGSWERLARFWTAEFPRLARTARPFVLVSFLLFALPALAGYLRDQAA